MKFKNTIIYAILVLGLGYYTFTEYNRTSQSIESNDKIRFLKEIYSTNFSKIKIQSSLNEIHLEKDNDGWSMMLPVEDRVDLGDLDTFFQDLRDETGILLEYNEKPLSDNDIGIDSPVATLELLSGDKVSWVKVSSKSTFDGKRYVKTSFSDAIYLVDSAFIAVMTRSANFFREKNLFPIHNSVEKIEVIKPNGSFTFLKDGEEWVAKDKGLKINGLMVDELEKAIRHLRAKDIFSEAKTKADQKSAMIGPIPYLKLKVNYIDESGKKAQWELIAGDSDQKRTRIVVSQKPVIYSLHTEQLSDLTKDLSYYLNRRFPFQFKKQKVTFVKVLKTKERKMEEVIRTADGWKLYEKNPHKEVLVKEVADFIDKLYLLEMAGLDYKGSQPFVGKVFLEDKHEQKLIFELLYSDVIEHNGAKYYYVKTSLHRDGFLVNEGSLAPLLKVPFIKYKKVGE